MLSLASLAVLLALAVLAYTWRSWQVRPSLSENTAASAPQTSIEDLRRLGGDHELLAAFLRLVRDDGAGSWPPTARHHGWPAALAAYATVYAEVAPLLATAEPSLDDAVNVGRCGAFRVRMRTGLAQHVDSDAVGQCLRAAVDRGDWGGLGRDGFNGFYSCVACLRHAYRWATNPVVRVAQNEKELAFPPELDLAWSYIQRHLDITSPSGNIMANAICNFDGQDRLTYLVNEGMSDEVLRTELHWCRIFRDSERLSAPMYCSMIRAIICHEQGDRRAALGHARAVLAHVRRIVLHLYDRMNEPNVSRAVWVRYVSGIHGWGLTAAASDGGRTAEYGGLSGSQALVFLAADAFVGMPAYHAESEMKMHVSRNMRAVAALMQRHCFRARLGDTAEDRALAGVMDRIVKQLRTFRGVHKVRAVRFLSAPAPERVPMTAALSVLDGQEKLKDMESEEDGGYASIHGLLAKRLSQTI